MGTPRSWIASASRKSYTLPPPRIIKMQDFRENPSLNQQRLNDHATLRCMIAILTGSLDSVDSGVKVYISRTFVMTSIKALEAISKRLLNAKYTC